MAIDLILVGSPVRKGECRHIDFSRSRVNSTRIEAQSSNLPYSLKLERLMETLADFCLASSVYPFKENRIVIELTFANRVNSGKAL